MNPFNLGKKAFWNGELNNPYPEDTIEHREWQYGFDRQYFGHLERVKEYEQEVEPRAGGEEVYRSQASPAKEIN